MIRAWIDVFSLAAFSACLLLFCAFFDHRASRSSSTEIGAMKRENLGLLATSLLVSASCFALGGSGANIDAISLVLLGAISIMLAREWRKEAWSGTAPMKTLLPGQGKATFIGELKAGLSLILRVDDSILLVLVIFFLGITVVPFLDPFDDLTWDPTTWRFAMVVVTCSLATVPFIVLLKTRVGSTNVTTNASIQSNKPRLLKSLAPLVIWPAFVLVGIPFFFLLNATQGNPFGDDNGLARVAFATMIVPVLHGLLAIRLETGDRVDHRVTALQCAWTAVAGALFIGAGGPAIGLLVKGGMNIEASMVILLVLVIAGFLDMLLIFGQKSRFRVPSKS